MLQVHTVSRERSGEDFTGMPSDVDRQFNLQSQDTCSSGKTGAMTSTKRDLEHTQRWVTLVENKKGRTWEGGCQLCVDFLQHGICQEVEALQTRLVTERIRQHRPHLLLDRNRQTLQYLCCTAARLTPCHMAGMCRAS